MSNPAAVAPTSALVAKLGDFAGGLAGLGSAGTKSDLED